MKPSDLTTDQILDAVRDGVVSISLAWEALDDPCPKREAARRAICLELSKDK